MPKVLRGRDRIVAIPGLLYRHDREGRAIGSSDQGGATDLLAYLDVGTAHERDVIREGKTVTGDCRGTGYVFNMATGKPLDLSTPDEGDHGDG